MSRRVEAWEIGRAVTQFMKFPPHVSYTLEGVPSWAIRKFIVRGKN